MIEGWTLLLSFLILVPLVFALGVVLYPERHARVLATIGTSLPLAMGAVLLAMFDWTDGAAFQFAGRIDWLPEMGLSFALGADAVSMLLIALTLLLGPICVGCSWTAITERVKSYYAWLLVLQAAMVGVFAARDLIVFYICFEFTLVPMYVLIALWGSTNRRRAATKFFLYTFTGSMITLAGLAYVAWYNARVVTGAWSFDIATLQEAALGMPLSSQGWVLAALLAGFAVKVPIFPFHTWLPLAHTEAPTAGSVILAGVLLKLGTYGLYRFAVPFAPGAIDQYAPTIAVFALIGIVYGGLICWVQTDVKKLVAYSSVAHLGFCVLGLVALNTSGLTGSVLYMLNHGLSTGALFLCVGMVYERYHTRNMKELGGLAARMPVWASFMVFFTMASVGLPGLNGFVSEFLCLIGAYQSSDVWAASGEMPGATPGRLGPWYAAIAGTGMIVAAIYLLYMVGKVVFGPLVEPHGHGHESEERTAKNEHEEHGVLPTDLNAREIATLVPIAALCVAFGIYPKPLLRALEAPVNETLAIVQANRAAEPVAPEPGEHETAAGHGAEGGATP